MEMMIIQKKKRKRKKKKKVHVPSGRSILAADHLAAAASGLVVLCIASHCMANGPLTGCASWIHASQLLLNIRKGQQKEYSVTNCACEPVRRPLSQLLPMCALDNAITNDAFGLLCV